ncbi:MAG TPA: hypothetical protein VGM19_12850 [Armatimonadota bacterium]|jgi:hypothetical protein
MDLRRCRSATVAAVKWLLTQQNSDGAMVPVEHGVATHNRVLWALNDMGQQPRAALLCRWLREYGLGEEGDFGGLLRPAPYDRFYAVGNAFLVVGAMRLGQYAIGYPALDFITNLQHPQSGGFLTAGPEATLDDEQDLLTTATCGLACLQGGQLESAERAGRFLLKLWEDQPGGAAARLFMVVNEGNKIVTECEPEVALWYAVDINRAEQAYFIPALGAGFLAALYDATGAPEFLEGMHNYLQFVDSCGEDRYRSEKSAFVGWAHALAYEITGNANYLRAAEQVVDALLATQLANGSWLKGSMGADLTSDVVDATAEGVIVLNQVLRSLAGAEE